MLLPSLMPFATTSDVTDKTALTIAVAIIPALVTLVGTLWQIYARRPSSPTAQTAPGESVLVLRLCTKTPRSTLHPWFAIAMVVWHFAVAFVLFGLVWLSLVDPAVILAIASVYLIAAGVYGIEYYRVRGEETYAEADIVVNAEAQALFSHCLTSVWAAGLKTTSLDRSDDDKITIDARAPGSAFRVEMTAKDRGAERRTQYADSEGARGWSSVGASSPTGGRLYDLHVRADPTRPGDGIPRAIQSMDAFLRSFVT